MNDTKQVDCVHLFEVRTYWRTGRGTWLHDSGDVERYRTLVEANARAGALLEQGGERVTVDEVIRRTDQEQPTEQSNYWTGEKP